MSAQNEARMLAVVAFFCLAVAAVVGFYPKRTIKPDSEEYIPIRDEVIRLRLRPYVIVRDGEEYRYTDIGGDLSSESFASSQDARVGLQAHIDSQKELQGREWQEVNQDQ